jgi:hypothetical protein
VQEGRGCARSGVHPNYERLRISSDAVAREARYTRYVEDGEVLRTHTSAIVRPALDRLAVDPPPEVVLSSVEWLEVVSETAYDELSVAARERLGIRPRQKSMLVRVVLRDLERTLTDDDANRLRDLIYAAIYEGTIWMWAAEGGAAPETQ